MTLLGFLGLKPVLVANENFVTQLSNFLCGGYVPCGACGIGFEVVTSRVIEARMALLSRLSPLGLLVGLLLLVSL